MTDICGMGDCNDIADTYIMRRARTILETRKDITSCMEIVFLTSKQRGDMRRAYCYIETVIP